MNRELYSAAASLAGESRAGYLPEPYRIAGADALPLPPHSKAVYVAVDGTGVVRYVGSVCRPRATGLRERIAEHVRLWWKERHWTHVWVIPLRDQTAPEDVKFIEGRIGRRLQPADTRRLPGGRGR